MMLRVTIRSEYSSFTDIYYVNDVAFNDKLAVNAGAVWIPMKYREPEIPDTSGTPLSSHAVLDTWKNHIVEMGPLGSSMWASF